MPNIDDNNENDTPDGHVSAFGLSSKVSTDLLKMNTAAQIMVRFLYKYNA